MKHSFIFLSKSAYNKVQSDN